MKSILLQKLLRLAPFAMAVFSTLLIAHGVHVVSSGDPGGPGGPD
jgi:hypothetical protein